MADHPEREIITETSALIKLCDRLSAAGWFAFDTEFVGEDSFQLHVCLIQVATESHCALIDVLAGLDVAPFWALVADEDVRVVVHAGMEDLLICREEIERPAAHVFDLQVAAGMVGLGFPTSLSRLLRSTLGIRLHKSQTLTDWRQRPLSREQIEYAVEDVIHLPRLDRFIRDRLKKLGREDWAAQECERRCRVSSPDAERIQKLRRIRGVGSLSRQELAIAEALAKEREILAQEYDRPQRAVLRDHLLVELARRGWTRVARVQSLRGLNLSKAAVGRLVEAIRKAKRIPPEQWPELSSKEDNAEEEVLIALLGAVLRDYCHHNDLAYALLASKQDLRELVRRYTRSEPSAAPVELETGWRGAAVGHLLERLLTGQCALRVADKGQAHRLIIE